MSTLVRVKGLRLRAESSVFLRLGVRVLGLKMVKGYGSEV